MTPRNLDLAAQLAELAAILRSRKVDKFRVRAYERAARIARSAPVDLAAMDETEVRRLAGVGETLARLIAEHGATGRIRMLEEIRGDEPPGFGALLRLPLIGARDARQLAGVHGFADVDALRAAVAAGRGLDELDERLAWRVRESLRRVEAVAGEATPMPIARREAYALASALAELDGVTDAVVAGAARRGSDTVSELALVLTAERPEEVADRVHRHRAIVRVTDRDDFRLLVVAASGHPTALWFAGPEAAGAALVCATGSDAHVAAVRERAASRGVALRADGVWRGGTRVAGATEEEVYGAAGLPWVPPALREGSGEVEAAAAGDLPRLVDPSDLRGDLHVHSDWSGDGTDRLDDMVAAAADRGYAFVAITDHAENLRINGMPREAVLARRRTITHLRREFPEIRVLDGAELNIGADGSLDYDVEFLLDFDFTVASVHSDMDRPERAQTDRVLAAVAHPAVHVIGHPTGRILGHRPGYAIDLEAIAQAAAETGTALEVNGSPRRLDLSGDMVRIALAAGATIAMSSDAHAVEELDYIAHAVSTGRRGWATPAQVLNCRSADDLVAFARDKQARA